MKKYLPFFFLCTSVAIADPITIINPGGEINNGVDRVQLSDPSVIGWDSDGGQAINDNTDYGNGGWRLSYEDSQAIWQLTDHVIAEGESFSLRFDAAIFGQNGAGDGFTPDLTLVGPGVRNGDFNDDTSGIDGRNFDETPQWFNIGSAGNLSQATRTTLPFDGTRNSVHSQNSSRVFAIDTGHTLATGEVFQASYAWRDASGWTDASDRMSAALFTTADNTPTGTRTILQTILSATSTQNSAYETEKSLFDPIPASANGKRLFAAFEGFDGSGNGAGFGRMDNILLQRGTVIEPGAPRTFTAEFYVGAQQVVATRTYDFKSNTPGIWHHYHLAAPAGSLDAFAGQMIGVRFRAGDSGDGNFQSIDNVRLETWPSDAAAGDFSDNWNSTPDQVWAGPGYWANRLHDWQVAGGRVNCILGGRDRRTLHRVGTTLRGNGADFAFSVRTGLHAGTINANARSGFLIGAGPNLDWRGALLVHDGLGRDFGLFLGLRGDGAAIIEDMSTGATSALGVGSSPVGGFPTDARLDLDATFNEINGEYDLTLSVYNPADTLLTSTTASVPSDQVLGSLGLLSHKGRNDARFWFDDYSGSGTALENEEDRHLAIISTLYTLSRGTLKLTAQLSPLDLGTASSVALEAFDGKSWQEISTTTINNTDNLSSYTASFRITNWNDQEDTDVRVRVDIGGTPYYWSGTVRRDPVDKKEIVVAATTCQRISDGTVQNNGFDWSPVRLWQPHTLAFTHLPKHDPDIFIANGDQIYEGQPTPEDSGNDFNRQHDYLYKWYLWVLQAREMTRQMPAIVEPDDHDIYQGNLWGEGGIVAPNQSDGGYEEPASWVKLVDRTQTSHLPDPDPYNPTQPAPPIAQGIGVYFTGLTYGRVGFAVLEDRKFKTGPNNPPADLNQQFLLGDRQKDFLRAWTTDWVGQDIKCVVSQSPLGNLHTHANTGYGFGLNDKDSHGWPVHRRNEAWGLLRQSRMFQIAGDQHLATVAKHGIDGPADAGYSFTVPAIANFFPRAWDPVHNSAGRTNVVNPYKGDFFFDGNGTLPSGEPNLTAQDPAHIRLLAAANPRQYYNQTHGVNPANLHDRGAGYGIIRIDKATRRVTFECWPLHADPEFPNTGSQFEDWPITISQTENDGRTPAGYLPVIDTGYRKAPVISVYDESDDSLVYSIRTRGNLVRPPVYDAGATYRIEITYGDGGTGESLPTQTPIPAGPAAINSFVALQPAIVVGSSVTLRWDVESPSTISIDGNDVAPFTVDGIGYLEVSPGNDTTYTLNLDGGITATTTVRVFADQATWLGEHFTPAELADPLISGDDADPDSDGFGNLEEYQFQTDPRGRDSFPQLTAELVDEEGTLCADFSSPYPLDSSSCTLVVEQSSDLQTWSNLPANSYREIARDQSTPTGTITVRLSEFVQNADPRNHYRARWHQAAD